MAGPGEGIVFAGQQPTGAGNRLEDVLANAHGNIDKLVLQQLCLVLNQVMYLFCHLSKANFYIIVNQCVSVNPWYPVELCTHLKHLTSLAVHLSSIMTGKRKKIGFFCGNHSA